MKEVKITKIKEVLSNFDNCIKNKKPFSLIRFGDGGLKYIDAIYKNDRKFLKEIITKEGIPDNKVINILNLWGFFARNANYIDSPYIYYSGKFWERCKKKNKPISSTTDKKMKKWKELYDIAEIYNNSYCNPEINYLVCLRIGRNKNLLDIMKNRKIGFITAVPEIHDNLKMFNIDVFNIVKHYEDHYKNSYKNIIKIIEENATKYDFWLVAAGELGRIYTGTIKFNSGRAFDIGFMAEYWAFGNIHSRLSYFIKPNPNNNLEFIFTDEGSKYKNNI